MPMTPAQVEAMLNRLPHGGKFVGRKEVKELPNLLADGEEVLDVVQGFYGKGTGILACTQRRLLFVDKGLLYGLKVEDFPLDKITSIQYSTGMLLGEITIFASGNKAVIGNVEKARTKPFAEGVRAQIDAATKKSTAAAAAPAQGDLMAEIGRLAEMKGAGLLTDEEFTAAKRKLLGL